MVTRVSAAIFACMLTLTLASGVATAQDDVQPAPAPPEPLPMRDAEPSESPREAQLNALAKARNFNDAQKRDVSAIWKMLDDAAGGKRTVNELPLSWVGQDAVKEGNLVFVPFTVMLDTARTAGGDVWLSWRAVPKSAPSGAQPRPKNQPVIEDISIVPSRQASGGRIARALVAPPGEYDLYIVARDVTPSRRGGPSPGSVPRPAPGRWPSRCGGRSRCRIPSAASPVPPCAPDSSVIAWWGQRRLRCSCGSPTARR